MQHHRKFDPSGHSERGGRRNLLESVYSFQKFHSDQIIRAKVFKKAFSSRQVDRYIWNTVFLKEFKVEKTFQLQKPKKRLLNEVFKTATFTQVDIQSDFLVPYSHISIKLNHLLNSKGKSPRLLIHCWQT